MADVPRDSTARKRVPTAQERILFLETPKRALVHPNLYRLADFERDFMRDIGGYSVLSEKQLAILDRIVAKLRGLA
jgi:hypothetical protein